MTFCHPFWCIGNPQKLGWPHNSNAGEHPERKGKDRQARIHPKSCHWVTSEKQKTCPRATTTGARNTGEPQQWAQGWLVGQLLGHEAASRAGERNARQPPERCVTAH